MSDNWLDGTWDYVRIDGQVLPGRIVDLEVEPTRNVTIIPVPGVNGPDIKDDGYAGSPVVITGEAWRAKQWPALRDFLAKLHPGQMGVTTRPHTIDHPICAAAKIDKIYVTGVKISMPVGNRLPFVITAARWNPQKKQAPLDGGSLDIAGPPAPDPSNLGAKFS